jgi:hypothetical protein
MQPFYLYILVSIKDMYSFISQFINGWKETINVVCNFLLAYKRITALSIQFPSMQLTVSTNVKDDICINRLTSMSGIIVLIAGYINFASSEEVPLSLGGD